MKTKTNQRAEGGGLPGTSTRPFLRLASNNGARFSPADAGHLSETRRASVRKTLVAHLDDPASAPVAAVLVSLRADGTVDMLAADVEPEFTPALIDGLKLASERLRQHGKAHSERRRNELGRASPATFIPLLFIAATYINEVAWIDAALSLIAQVSVCLLTRRRS